MDREETKKILMMIQSLYPNFNPQDKSVAINAWQMMLDDFTYEQVSIGLKAYARTNQSGFAPSVGQIIDKIHGLSEGGNEINEMEAWGMVQKAVRNSTYHSEEEYAKLPPIVQRAIASPTQLREWAIMEDVDGSGVNVMQSHFSRAFRREQEKAKEIQRLSPDLQKIAGKNSADRIGYMTSL